MSENTATQSVELSADILKRVESQVTKTEFADSKEYIEYVLEEVFDHAETETTDQTHEAINEDDVEDRLRSLGYLNE